MKRKLTPEEQQKLRDQEPVFCAVTGMLETSDSAPNVIPFPLPPEKVRENILKEMTPTLADDDEI